MAPSISYTRLKKSNKRGEGAAPSNGASHTRTNGSDKKMAVPGERAFAGQKARPNELNVLIFKDNLASRSFKVPFRWLTWFGVILGVFALVIVLSLFTAFKNYRLVQRSDPARVVDLERKLEETQKQLDIVMSEKGAAAPVLTAPTLESTPSSPSQIINNSNSILAALPPGYSKLGPGTEPPVQVEKLTASWIGRALQIQGDLLYFKKDGGNQQGRIVALARGPESLFGFPKGVLSPTVVGVLIDPGKGEFFSVSRYRQLKANFRSLLSKSEVTHVEVLLFGLDQKLLVHQTLVVPQDAPAAPKEAEAPAETTPPPPAPLPPAEVAPDGNNNGN